MEALKYRQWTMCFAVFDVKRPSAEFWTKEVVKGNSGEAAENFECFADNSIKVRVIKFCKVMQHLDAGTFETAITLIADLKL